MLIPKRIRDKENDGLSGPFISFFSFPLFFIFLVVVIWVLIFYDLRRTEKQLVATAQIQLGNLTKIYAEEVTSSLKALDNVVLDLRDKWPGELLAFDSAVENTLNRFGEGIVSAGVISKDGQLIYESLVLKPPLIDISDREYFRLHRTDNEDKFRLSKPLILRASQRLAVIATRPLLNLDGSFNGVIAVTVSPEYFSRFQEKINLGEASVIALARTNGDLVARYPRPGQAVDTTIENAPWIGAGSNEEGILQRKSPIDGIERLFSWRVLKDGGMVVSMGQSVKTVMAPYYQQRRTYFWGGGTATSFIMLVAYLLRRNQIQREKTNTQLKRLEGALAHSQRLESVGKLTGSVAHDFNNILQIISSNVQLMEMNPAVKKEIEPNLRGISDAVHNGAHLASQILTFARRQPLHPSITNPHRLIYKIDNLIKGLVGNNIDVQIQDAEDIWNILVDLRLFENVILNLAANARDAMNNRGVLRFKLSNETIGPNNASSFPGIEPADYVLLAVTDTGSGMPPEVVEHIFEPFFTTKPEGTGLGLAMAYGFVKASGGHIQVQSDLDVGTTILIFLPRSNENELQEVASTAPSLSGGTETVLVVEDNGQLRNMAVVMLAQLGYRTLGAVDAAQAIKIFEEEEGIDILLVDVHMPGGMDGIELTRKLKIMRPDLTVLLASGAYELEESLSDMCATFDHIYFLQKPYSLSEVDRIIRMRQLEAV